MRTVLALIFACLPVLAADGTPFQWRGQMALGKTLEVRGVNGGIRAEATSGLEAEVTAKLSARRSNPNDVRIEVVPHADGILVCAIYPSAPGEPANECRLEGGRNNVKDNDTNVEFTVRVPRGVNLVAKTVNGQVSAKGLESNVTAKTVNGGIVVSTTGTAQASSVNGGIEASMGTFSGNVDFSTVNGGIELGLPASTNAVVSATTVNGSLQSDFPMTVNGKFGPRKFNGRIGSGGSDLNLKTVNGDIKLRRAS